MNAPRTRTRKPAPEVADIEGITVTEVIGAETPAEEPVENEDTAQLRGPFTRRGFTLYDAQGSQIGIFGRSGDMARTGPAIADAVLAKLNA